MFSNEHVNYLITYPFDFRNEELLSYYISFLRYAPLSSYFMPSSFVLSIFLYTLYEFCFVVLTSVSQLHMGWERAISGKLNKDTISLLVKTENVSFTWCCLISVVQLIISSQ